MTNKVTVADFPAWEKRTKKTYGPCARRYVGRDYRRILGVIERDGWEYSLHATKGIRRKRKVI